MNMHIQCQECGHHQKVDLKLFANILGAATAGFGWFGWTTFLFAGTGFAMPICIAIIAGGAAMLKYSDEIAAWLSKQYPCPKCGAKNWKAVSEDQLQLKSLQEKTVTLERFNEVNVFPVMRKLYAEANEYLYLSFPWYNIDFVKNDFLFLQDARDRGVAIHIYYGIKPRSGKHASDDKGAARRTLRAIEWLKENLGERNVFYHPVDCHIKAILCEKYSLDGSHNLFTYRPQRKDRGETMAKHIGKKAVEDLRKQITSQPELIQLEEFAFA